MDLEGKGRLSADDLRIVLYLKALVREARKALGLEDKKPSEGKKSLRKGMYVEK